MRQFDDLLVVILEPVEIGEGAFVRKQAFYVALLHDLSVLQYHDFIRALDGGHAMSYHDYRAGATGLIYVVLYEHL